VNLDSASISVSKKKGSLWFRNAAANKFVMARVLFGPQLRSKIWCASACIFGAQKIVKAGTPQPVPKRRDYGSATIASWGSMTQSHSY